MTTPTDEEAIERITTAIALVGPYGNDAMRARAAWTEAQAIMREREEAQRQACVDMIADHRSAGGHARAAALTPERRSEIASNAAKKRWKLAGNR